MPCKGRVEVDPPLHELESSGPRLRDGSDLQEAEYEQRFQNGPRGTFKNLIFAAVGPKPQIVLRDAVSNEVEIVRNADNCLVYKDPLPAQGLTWRQMVTWWQTHHMPDTEEPEAADALYRRLYHSLDSLPEQTVLRTYCTRYAAGPGRPRGSKNQRPAPRYEVGRVLATGEAYARPVHHQKGTKPRRVE
ncbi:hypothetical protein OG471_00210 [Streptomyces sp. NBC_01336]|uniref:hypothetical protein n=1 Tax=Streptomyces sp. NBC_01336 TaxID=2903829 RepID=UPI002E11DA78|nr:hypothetical protein OG471_00210 [Streptomyces sp. NBC_01336]